MQEVDGVVAWRVGERRDGGRSPVESSWSTLIITCMKHWAKWEDNLVWYWLLCELIRFQADVEQNLRSRLLSDKIMNWVARSLGTLLVELLLSDGRGGESRNCGETRKSRG